MPVQTHKEGGITWVVLQETVEKGMDWKHLPRDQILGMNKRPVQVGRPMGECLEGVHEAQKETNQTTRAIFSIIDNVVKDTTAAEILSTLEEEGRKYHAGTNNTLVQYTISGRIFELLCN